MPESEVESGGPAILRNSKPDAELFYEPCSSRMLQHFNRGPGRIVCLGHSQRSRIPRDMHDPAIRKPLEQFRYVSNVDGKLDTSALRVAEACNLFYKNSCDRAQASVGFLNLSRNSLFQVGIGGGFNIYKAPENAVQAGQILLGKTQLDHFINVLING